MWTKKKIWWLNLWVQMLKKSYNESLPSEQTILLCWHMFMQQNRLFIADCWRKLTSEIPWDLFNLFSDKLKLNRFIEISRSNLKIKKGEN